MCVSFLTVFYLLSATYALQVGTPVTAESFAKWTVAKAARKQAEAEARVKAEQAKKKGGKGLCKYYLAFVHIMPFFFLTFFLLFLSTILSVVSLLAVSLYISSVTSSLAIFLRKVTFLPLLRIFMHISINVYIHTQSYLLYQSNSIFGPATTLN